MKLRQERVGLFFIRAGQRPDLEIQTEPCEHSKLGGSPVCGGSAVSLVHSTVDVLCSSSKKGCCYVPDHFPKMILQVFQTSLNE